MFGRKRDDGIDLINHRLDNIEKELSQLNTRFANILVQRIVYTVCGAILMAVIMAVINGNVAALIGG